MSKLGVTMIVAIACAFAAEAQPTGYADAKTQVMITGKEVIDPPPGQKNDRAALFLAGAGARRIYDAMPTPIRKDDICEPGLRLKQSGGLICSRHAAGDYECSVAILLKTGETRPAGAC